MHGEVEHANINVGDLDATVAFLLTALPQFKVRHRGTTDDGVEWLHVGTDSTYLALNQLGPGDSSEFGRLNHVGFVVDDAEAIKLRCLSAGYEEGFVTGPHPHRKRVYILDKEGMEWEFVEYLSEDVEKRNDYSDL